MKLESIEWVQGRWDSNPNARLDGSWTIARGVEGFLEASKVMACGDLEKKIMSVFDGTKPPLGLLAYPSHFEIWDREYTNIINPVSQPKFRGGQQTSVLVAGSMDVLIEEDFDSETDFNKTVYLLPNGKLSLLEPSTGEYWIAGNVKKGIGKKVTVAFEFTNPTKKIAGVSAQSASLSPDLEEAKKIIDESKNLTKAQGQQDNVSQDEAKKGGKK